jgi:hypothetical protein
VFLLHNQVEAYEKIPTITFEDIPLLIRSLLLDISQQMAEGKTIDQILHADAEALGIDHLNGNGYGLNFQYYEKNPEDPTDDLEIVTLRGDLGNDNTTDRYGRLIMRYTSYFFIFQLPDGQKVVGNIMALYNPVEPVDSKNPGLSAQDPGNWLFYCNLLPGYGVKTPFYKPEDLKKPEVYDYLKYYLQRKGPMPPYAVVYATAPYAKGPNVVVFNPELVEVPDPENPEKTIQVPKGQLSSNDPLQSVFLQILQFEKNDASKIKFWQNNIKIRMSELGTLDENGKIITVREVPIPQGLVLPSELQLMLSGSIRDFDFSY